jgi:hypothetical protein
MNLSVRWSNAIVVVFFTQLKAARDSRVGNFVVA